MKAKRILGLVGTYVIVGAASTAGAALWTNVLEDKFHHAGEKIATRKSDKIINFKMEKRRMSR